MRVQVFGAFDPRYARNRILREGLRRLGVRVDACRAPGWRWTLPRYAALVQRFLALPRPDVLLVPEFRHRDVPLARALATLRGAPLVVDPLISRYETRVGDWRSARPGTWAADHARRVDRAAVRFADRVLCDTAEHLAYFRDHYRVPEDRLAVVPVGYDDAVFTPQPQPPERPFRVAFFGSFLPLHGVDTIVAAARLLRDDGVRFTLIGSGHTWSHVQRGVAEGLPLECCPDLPPPRLVERLRRAHVLLGIFGTSAKAARVVPNKVYQGLALERAMVTADTPAIRAAFEPGRHLWTVPPGDAAALAGAIRALRGAPERRAALAAAGAQRVREAFAPEAVARAFLAALRDLEAPEGGQVPACAAGSIAAS